MKILSLFPLKTDDDGLWVLDIEVTNKMVTDFEPFEMEEYDKVIKFIDEKYPNVQIPERWDLIDKLLFK